MSIKYTLARDANGNQMVNGYARQPTRDNYSMVLVANAAQSVVVPSNYPYWVVIFGIPDAISVWVDTYTTAASPTGAAAATTAQLNPEALYLKAGTTISIVTANATSPQVGVSFYYDHRYSN